ncbi:hypothetical protein Tco_1350619 [Tanacetum coccineum]
MDPVMHCATLPSHSSFSQKILVSFVMEINTTSIDFLTPSLGGNRKKPYETGEPRVTEEIAFLAIPRNSLTDAPIILKIFGGKLPPSRVDRPPGNHGRTEKKQNHHTGVRYSEMLLLQCHFREDKDKKPQSRSLEKMYANRGNAEFMEGNTMALVHGADVKDKRANHTTPEDKKGAYSIRRILGGRYKKGKGETSGNPSEEHGCIRLNTNGELGCASIRYGTPVESEGPVSGMGDQRYTSQAKGWHLKSAYGLLKPQQSQCKGNLSIP